MDLMQSIFNEEDVVAIQEKPLFNLVDNDKKN